MPNVVISEIKKEHIFRLASENKRVDGREPTAYRDIAIETGVIDSAEGSAKVKLGNTILIAGVKMNPGQPFSDAPNKGVLTTNAELLPMAAPDFDSGAPTADAIELARVTDRGIRESRAIDLGKLVISPGEEVWIVYIDMHVLNYGGNLFDAAGIAALAALKNTVVPAASFGKGDDFPLPTISSPVPCTVVKIGNSHFCDPSLDEDLTADARLTVFTDENGNVRAMQKGLIGSFSYDDVRSIVNLAIQKGNELRRHIG